jgi:hypothetical protein
MTIRMTAFTLALILVMPLCAAARAPGGGGGGSRGGGGGGGGGGMARPAGGGGFNLGRDTGAMTRSVAAPGESNGAMGRPSAEQPRMGSTAASGAYRESGNFRAPASGGRAPSTPRGGWPREHGAGFVVANPRYHGSAWGWNNGNVWGGYSDYWGDGFWGPFALGSLTGAYIVGDDSQDSLPYYQVAANSPGAQLLANYQLTQTPCGPSNLVVINGPNGGTICAYPNTTVAPGSYTIDESSLTLTSS